MKNWTLPLLAGVAAAALITPTLAADLIVDPPAPVPDMAASGDWEGAYAGIFGGYATGLADHLNPGAPVNFPDGADAALAGWLLGVKAGYNFYLSDNVVGGVVGDIAWAGITGDGGGPYPVIGNSTNGINWEGSVRGIIGVDAGSFLPYLTGGLAFADAWHDVDGVVAPSVNTVNALHVGWTVGAGVEIAATEQMSINLEYRYTDFGTQAYVHNTLLPDPPQFALTQHAVTVGLNWSF